MNNEEFISRVICDLGRTTIELSNLSNKNQILTDKLYEVRRNLRRQLDEAIEE